MDFPGAGQGAGRVRRERRGARRRQPADGAMFSKMPSLQEMLQDLGELRLGAHGRIRHRPAAPAADRAGRAGRAPVRRHRARPRGQRHRRRCLPPPSRPLLGLRRVRSARRQGLGQGDRAGDEHARAQRRGAQLALPGPLHRRARVLPDPRGARGDGRRALHPPDRAVQRAALRDAAGSSARSAASRTTSGCTPWG